MVPLGSPGLCLCEDAKPDRNPDLPTVVVVTTGGTIAEKTDKKTGGAVPAVSGRDLVEAVPGLAKIAKFKAINFSNIDSSQMTPELWAKISKTVTNSLSDPKVRGVVVTHGTDTMAEGSCVLDLAVESDKPVVFVGAMRDASNMSPDGPFNCTTQCSRLAPKKVKRGA